MRKLFVAIFATMLPFAAAWADNVAKIGETECETLAEAVSAAKSGEIIHVVAQGTYTIPTISNNITIKGDVEGIAFNCIGDEKTSVASIPNGATFESVSFDFGNVNYHGFQHAGKITMNGCTLNGRLTSYGDMDFTNCQFIQTYADYHMWVYGKGTVNYTNCTFTGLGKFLNLYSESSTNVGNVNVSGCKFINTSSTASKAALNVKATSGSTLLEYAVNVENCSTEGAFPAASSSSSLIVFNELIQVDDRPATGTDNITVSQDGVVIYQNGSTPVPGVAKIGDVEYESLQAALDAAEATDAADIVIDLLDDATLDITAWDGTKNSLSIGTINTQSIIINGNNHTLTFNQKNSDWNNVATMNDAQTKLILNDMNITNSGYNNGPWNRHDINFNCAVELNNVTSDKALAFKNDAILKDVNVTDTSGSIYGIWIQPNGQNIKIEGLTLTVGRGIKIDQQYVDNPALVTLDVKNATFNTTQKAAILVLSDAGATITAENINIENVAADKVNAVWVDEAKADKYGLVTVTGASKGVEGGTASYEATLSTSDNIDGYYKSLAAAIAAVSEGQTVGLVKDITLSETIACERSLVLKLGDFTITKGEYSIMLSQGLSVSTDKKTDVFATDAEGCKIVETATDNGFTYTAADLKSTDIVLKDGEACTITNAQVKSASYVRSFGDDRVNKFQGWFVPFDYTITDKDAENFKFFKISMIANTPNAGEGESSDEVWIFLTKVGSGTILRANKPYVYKPISAQENYSFTTEGAELKAYDGAVAVKTETTENVYSFYGNYGYVTTSASDPFYYMAYSGELSFDDGSANVTVGPFRWILRVTSKSGEADYSRSISFIDGNEQTGVNYVVADSDAVEFFMLNGTKVDQPSKGVYIVKKANGEMRKVFVKKYF